MRRTLFNIIAWPIGAIFWLSALYYWQATLLFCAFWVVGHAAIWMGDRWTDFRMWLEAVENEGEEVVA